MSKRTEKVIGVSEIFIIIVLMSLLIVLFGYYAFLQVNGSYYSLMEFPDSEKYLFSSEYDDSVAKKNLSYIVPEFVGFSIDGKRCFCGFDESHRNIVIDCVKNIFSTAFKQSISFDKKEFSDIVQKKEYFESLYSQKDYIYISFYSDLPFDVISTILNVEETGYAFMFKTIYLVQNKENSKGVLCDTSGNVYEFVFDGSECFNIGDFAAYIDIAGTEPFDFDRDYVKFPIALLSKSSYTKNIKTNIESLKSEHCQEILKAFKLNPDSASVYESPNGDVTYIENTNELSFLRNNIVEYVSYESQNDLNEISLYYPMDGIFNFADYVRASYNIINLFDTSIFGGEATVGLVSVEFENPVLTFRFKYFINGVAIESENSENDITISFSENSLKYFKARFVKFENTDSTTCLTPQKLVYNLEKESTNQSLTGFFAVYAPVSNQQWESYSCKWLLKTKN